MSKHEQAPSDDIKLTADVELRTLLEQRAALGADTFRQVFPAEEERLRRLLAAKGRANVPRGSAQPATARRKR